MKFKFGSKIFAAIFWVALVVFIAFDVLAYIIVIFPGKMDFGFIDHLSFFAWFIGKLAAFICLLFGRGPIKYCVYFSMFPLLLTGIYCTTIFPLTSGAGYTLSTLYNLIFIFIALGVSWLTNKFIISVNGDN